GSSEVGAGEVGTVQRCVRKLRAAKVGIHQISVRKDRIREVYSCEVAAGEIVVTEVDSAQVARLVGGRRVELIGCDAGSGEVFEWPPPPPPRPPPPVFDCEIRAAYVGPGEVGIGQRSSQE